MKIYMHLLGVLVVAGLLVSGTWMLLDNHFDSLENKISEEEQCWMMDGDHVRAGICYIDKDGERSIVNLREAK